MKWVSFSRLQNLIYLCLFFFLFFLCVCSHGSIGAIDFYKEICLCLCVVTVVVHNICPFEVVVVKVVGGLFKASRYCYCWFVLHTWY